VITAPPGSSVFDAPAPAGALILATALAGFAGIAVYRRYAHRAGILAHPNERTLHAAPVPRGGGIVIIGAFLLSLAVLLLASALPERLFAASLGAIPLAIIGFVDDVREVDARARFVTHVAVAAWVLAWLGGIPHFDVGPWRFQVPVAGQVLVAFGIVCMINLFNFMDGADALAASGSVIFAVGSGVLAMLGGNPSAGLAMLLLAASCSGFLVFNWPPARIFMGDSGSAVLGYVFAVFAIATSADGTMSLWTWTALMSYFLADTGTTFVLRLLLVKRWWGAHRSHAYQNLAYDWKDHRRVTLLVSAYSVFWGLPLAAGTILHPEAAPLLAAAALAPGVGVALRWGPLYRR
jgi:Fuc2NAc and GlcNAc transferase